jgi:cytochrome c-type biogenesis protein CcmH
MPEMPSRIATLRSRLLSLADAHARGELDATSYEAARRDAERELSEAVIAAPDAFDAAQPATRRRPSARLVAMLTVFVIAVAISGYALTGSPSLAGLGTPPIPLDRAADSASDKDREAGLQQIAAMVDKLAERMKSRPDDAEGWTMLARSYTVLGRYPEAVPAYRRAIELQPKNAALLADYSDALASANGGQPTAESIALIDRALAIEPDQPKALALSGTIAFDRGDYAAAAAQWQKIADALPPGSEFHQQVEANIDEARRRGGLAPATASAGSKVETNANVKAAISGTVTLAPEIASRAAPTDTVFVFARALAGPRMPLAVYRATVADLPLTYQLDDSMAMTPATKLSSAKQVIVGARISKSGNAIPQAGDLAGESAPIVPGANGVAITIKDVVGAR